MAINASIYHLSRLKTWDMEKGPGSLCSFPGEDTPIRMTAGDDQMVRRYCNGSNSAGLDSYDRE